MKMNKQCIPPDFLTKADPGTVQYTLNHANNFILYKQKSSFPYLQCTLCHVMIKMQEKNIDVLCNYDK